MKLRFDERLLDKEYRDNRRKEILSQMASLAKELKDIERAEEYEKDNSPNRQLDLFSD